MRLDGQGHAEQRADRTRVAGHRKHDAIGLDRSARCFDAGCGTTVGGETLHLAVLDDVDAARCRAARIAPGHGVVAHRTAAALYEAANDWKAARQVRVQLRSN